MTKEEKNLQTVPVENGLVAFFDVLGFKKMLAANAVEESLDIINACMLEELTTAEKIYGKFNIQTFVISDSILIALSNLTSKEVMFFTMFCQQFIWGLLMNGLPVRGAIASGKFSVLTRPNQIVLVGQPIIDAHELVNSLEIAACALTPSSESDVLKHLRNGQFKMHKTPIKNFPACGLYLLKYGTACSREQMIHYFEKHNKHLDFSSFNKLNNTIEFLKACGDFKLDQE
jgi:hypothetical protein